MQTQQNSWELKLRLSWLDSSGSAQMSYLLDHVGWRRHPLPAQWLTRRWHTRQAPYHNSAASCLPVHRQRLSRYQHLLITTHTHTHPFNGHLSGTTRVCRYQKGKTNLDFTEARDSEWQWHQLGHMQVCTSAPWSREITMPAPHHSVFYRLDALPAAQPTVSKHWRQ